MVAVDSMLDQALRYLERGWSIFPVCSPVPGEENRCVQHGSHDKANKARALRGQAPLADPGKHPLVSWAEFQQRQASPDEAAAWWKKWPAANIGVATGACSGLILLDADGMDAYTAVLSNGGIEDTLTVITGRPNSFHWYFAHPGYSVRNFAGNKGTPGLDFRGDGGYAVLPPSLHKSGRQYTWHNETAELAPAPAWLLDLLTGPAGLGGSELSDTPVDLILVLEGITEGQRDTELYRVACRLRGANVPLDVALFTIREAARGCRPPFDETSAVEKVQRAYREFQPNPTLGGVRANASSDAPTEERRPLTDTGNAERMQDRYAGQIRYCAAWKTWLTYDGNRWRSDDTGLVTCLAIDTARSIYAEAAGDEDKEERKAFASWAIKSESGGHLREMVKLAASLPQLVATPGDFDRDPLLINIANGTFDLRTGELRPAAREDLITKLCPVPYETEATCPRWEAFLEQILPHADMRAFIQRAAGYSLTGLVNERVLLILHGGGSNGKSTMLTLLRAVAGDYAVSTPAETLLVHRVGETRHDIARLKGARLVTMVEVEEGQQLAESFVKQITGGTDPLEARELYGKMFPFLPEFKIWLATNHKPQIKGTDNAIWGRIRLLPFTVQIPPSAQDRHLDYKLRAELPGILRWMIDGALAWYVENREGRSGLPDVAEIEAATSGYRGEQDILAGFMDDCCTVDPKARSPMGDIYAAYTRWCEASEVPSLGKTTLTKRLEERGFAKHKAGGAWRWFGLGLLGSSQNEDELL